MKHGICGPLRDYARHRGHARPSRESRGSALPAAYDYLQYRNKPQSAALRLTQARALLALCWEYQVPLIINDHLDLALALDARRDCTLALKTAQLSRRENVSAATRYSAFPATAGSKTHLLPPTPAPTYVAFGGFFPSKVKPGATRTPIELLRAAKRELKVPVVAIGGITLDNAPALLAAGADSVAVITALFDASDIRRAQRAASAKLFRKRP